MEGGGKDRRFSSRDQSENWENLDRIKHDILARERPRLHQDLVKAVDRAGLFVHVMKRAGKLSMRGEPDSVREILPDIIESTVRHLFRMKKRGGA